LITIKYLPADRLSLSIWTNKASNVFKYPHLLFCSRMKPRCPSQVQALISYRSTPRYPREVPAYVGHSHEYITHRWTIHNLWPIMEGLLKNLTPSCLFRKESFYNWPQITLLKVRSHPGQNSRGSTRTNTILHSPRRKC